MRRPHARRFGFAVLAVAFGLGVGLAAVEVIARAVPLVVDKTMIPFREMPGDEAFAPQPSARARTLRGKIEQTNRFGLRDPERPLVRPEHALPRVALVGDSVVWGFGLDADDAIPRRLEAELLAAGTPAEAWTLAQPATNMANHRARWARLGPQVQPDALVTFVVFNDLLPTPTRFRITPQGLLASPRRRAPYPDAVRPFIDRSAAFALALRGVYAWEQRSQPHLDYSLENVDRLTADLAAIIELDPSIPALVVLVPGRGETSEEYQGMREALSALAEREDVRLLDLSEPLGQPAADRFMQTNDSTHPNALGSALIAQAIAPVVGELLGR